MFKKTCIVITLLLLSFSLSAKPLYFTAIPDQDASKLQIRFNKVANYLSDYLGVPVRYIPVKSYSASVAAFRNNEVQLAWFGGLSGVKARRAVPGSRAIAQGDEDRKFKTYFIAHTSTGLKPSEQFPSEIRQKTFTFGSKGSTSGRLMPEYYIRNHFNSSPRKIFKRVGFSGNHSKTISLVESGVYQIGAVNYKVWENEVKSGKIDTAKVRVIWKTPTYVDYNWTVRGDLEQAFGSGFIEKVQKALLDMKDKNLLDAFPRKKFIAADNAMYQPILDTGTAIGIFEN